MNVQGPPTWAYLQLALGDLPVDQALEPLKRMSENFRMRLADMWNLRALTHTDGSIQPAETTRPIEQGAPREQGHYGFMLTDTYLYPLLSGQRVNMAEGKLLLEPYFPPPYVLPVLLSGVEGSIASETAGSYTLSVAFGKLELPAGGLFVDGVAFKQPVNLVAGQNISWSVNLNSATTPPPPPPDFRHEKCRIHNDPGASAAAYPWRKAWYRNSSQPEWRSMDYGYCEGGQGPWVWGASNVTVQECEAKASALNSSCFDYMCAYHEGADCVCPPQPPIVPKKTAKKVACVGKR